MALTEAIITLTQPDAEVPVIETVRKMGTKTVKTEVVDEFSKPAPVVREFTGIEDKGFKRQLTNKISKAYTSQDGRTKSSRIDESEITGYDVFGVIQPPFNIYAFTKVYELSAPHYAAVNAKVSNIVGLGYNFILSRKSQRALAQASIDAAKKKEQADFEHAKANHDALESTETPSTPGPRPPADHNKKLDKLRQALDDHKYELIDQMEDLNFEDGFVETLTKVWRDYEVTGNGYIEIGRKGDGTVGYLGHIPSHTMRVRKDRDGFVQVVNGHAQFFANFGDKRKRSPFNSQNRPNEIIHLKKYSPSNTFYGVPDIVAAQQAIAGNEYAAQFNLDYFENKAVPRHLITLTGAKLGPQAENDLLSFFETTLKGQNHRAIYIPLPPAGPDGKAPELKFEPIEAGVQEGSFKQYNSDNTDFILMVHRVPKTKISVSVGASVALAQDADKTFKEQVCAPEQRMLENKLNRVIKEFTDAYTFKLNEMTLTDENTRSQINERYAKVGVFTRNEIRDTLGKGAIDKGDEIIDLNSKGGESGSGAPDTAQLKAEANANRERDAVRSATSSDNQGAARNAKGEGKRNP